MVMEEKKTEIDLQYIDKLEKHQENTKANIKYSLDRFDILIITISSGGLVLSLNFLKEILSSGSYYCSTLIFLSWIAFASAIIINLFSQVSGYFANKIELKITKNIIRKEKKKPEIINQSKFEKKKTCLDNLTQIFNGLSLLALILGIILLIIFINNTLK